MTESKKEKCRGGWYCAAGAPNQQSCTEEYVGHAWYSDAPFPTDPAVKNVSFYQKNLELAKSYTRSIDLIFVNIDFRDRGGILYPDSQTRFWIDSRRIEMPFHDALFPTMLSLNFYHGVFFLT